MGRLFGGDTQLNFEPEPWAVYLWDPFMRKRIHPSGKEKLVCQRIVNAPGPYGGMAEFLHTGYPISQYTEDDSKKLLGAIVQVVVEGDTLFAGTITGIKKRFSIDNNEGTDSYLFEARDAMHLLADKLMPADFPAGISSGGLAGVVAGGTYSSWTRNPSGNYGGVLTTVRFDPPLLPCNDDGEAIVAISPLIVNAGIESFPRRFSDRPQQINELLAMICLEQKADLFYSMPEPVGSDIIATIVPVNIGDDSRPIVLGAPSENDFDAPELFPVASSIVIEDDYSGVLTQINAVGGDITQSVFMSLVPAWNPNLEAEVIADRKLVKEQESKYGAVGRIFTIGSAPYATQFIPFVSEPQKRHASEAFSSTGADTVPQLVDGCKVYEFRQSEESDDQTDDSLWQESQENWSLLPYNDEMAASGLINVRGKVKRDLARNRMNLVMFEEPQFQDFYVRTGGTDEAPIHSKLTIAKPMYIEGMRVRGVLGYSTGHKGNFPRPRIGMIFDREWTAHLSNYYTDDGARERLRFVKTANGLVSDVPTTPIGSRFDRSPVMRNEADTLVKVLSRPATHATIEIQGISKEYKQGTTIPQVLDVDGSILLDELELMVRQVEYTDDDRTILHADQELVA